MDPRVSLYANFYQTGGGAFYSGLDEQYGEGIGNFFGRLARGLWNFVRPAAAEAATALVSSAAQGLNEGKSFKESARQALGSSVGAAIRGIGEQAERKIQGGGRRRSGRLMAKRRRKQGGKRRKGRKQVGGKRRKQVGVRKRRVYKKARRFASVFPPTANF